jgi:DNA-binding transcriptional regulator YiaG
MLPNDCSQARWRRFDQAAASQAVAHEHKTLGDLIQVKRNEKRLTLPQLAEKMGIAPAVVRAWEDNSTRPNDQQLAELSGLLNCASGIIA